MVGESVTLAERYENSDSGVWCERLMACEELHKLMRGRRGSGSVEIDTQSEFRTTNNCVGIFAPRTTPPRNSAHGHTASKLNPGLTAAKRTRRTPTWVSAQRTTPSQKSNCRPKALSPPLASPQL